MAILVETMDEYNWRTGRNYFYVYSGNGLIENDIINLALCVGNYDICITGIEFCGSSSILTWNWYVNTVLDISTGKPIDEIKSNELVDSSSGVKLLLNPDIEDTGEKMIDGDLDSLGINAAAGRVKLNDMIVTKNITISKNRNHLIKIKNRHVGSCNVEVKVYFFKIPSFILNDSEGKNVKEIF